MNEKSKLSERCSKEIETLKLNLEAATKQLEENKEQLSM